MFSCFLYTGRREKINNKQQSGHWSALMLTLRTVLSLSTKGKIVEEMPREAFLCFEKYKLLVLPDGDSGISEGRASSLVDQSRRSVHCKAAEEVRLASLLMCIWRAKPWHLAVKSEGLLMTHDWIKIWYHMRYISGDWIKGRLFKYAYIFF